MSFKSYAQGGQYGTYHIELPIKTEINEDLRAAGDFAKQMERSQNYREKWASSYLTALNNKSNVERQNRDDNFEFASRNFKAIYEGEQREFEGRLSELQREHAEAGRKEAEPGVMEQLFPLLLQLAPMAGKAIQQGQAAKAEQALAEKNLTGERLVQYYSELGVSGTNLITEQKRIGLLGGTDRRAALAELAAKTKIPEETLGRFFLGDGTHTYAAQTLSSQRVGQRTRLDIQARTYPGGDLHINEFSSQSEQNNKINNALFQAQAEALGGEKEFYKLGEHVRQALHKDNGAFKRSLTASQTAGWGAKWKGVGDTVLAVDVSNGFLTDSMTTVIDGLAQIEIKQGVNPAVANLRAVEQINTHATAENGITAAEYNAKVRVRLADKLKLPNIPETTSNGVWGAINRKHAELRKGEAAISKQQFQAETAQSKQVIEAGKKVMLANPISVSSKYFQEQKDSYQFSSLSADTQKWIDKMASDPHQIREFLRTEQSFEAKSGLPTNHQRSVVMQVMAGDLAIGAAGKDWKANNLTLIDMATSYTKIKFQEIKQENPGLHNSVAYERAAVEAWTEMTGPKGNIKIIPGETAADPVTTNYSSGADIYKNEVNSKTNFIQKIKPLILSGSSDFLNWPGQNIHNMLASINQTNALFLQRNPGMDGVTPQQVRDTIYSPWIQTIVEEKRKLGIVISGSEELNIQGEAWAKQTGQKWTPIDHVTQEDLGKASARARRDLQQIYNHSAVEGVTQAHLNKQNHNKPYQPNAQLSSWVKAGSDPDHSGSKHHEHVAFVNQPDTANYIRATKLADQRRGGGVYNITSTFRAGDYGSDHSKGSMEKPFAVDTAPATSLPYTAEAEKQWRDGYREDLRWAYTELGLQIPSFLLEGN